jgi:RHS repeat-associated protein
VRPVALALAALLLGAQPAVIIGAAAGPDTASAATLGAWDAQNLPALAGTDGDGPTLYELENVRTDMAATSVTTSTRPVLTTTLDASASGQRVLFRILGADGRRVLSSSPAVTVVNRAARWQVPRGVLKPFTTYQMALVDAANVQTQILAPRPLTVDVQRAGEQQAWAFAGVNVAKVTGEPILAISSPGVTTLAGTAGFQMQYRPSNAPMPGMPSGWHMNPSGPSSRWINLRIESGQNVVTLSQADGFTVTFTRTGPEGAFVAQVGPHHDWPGGGYADLYQNENGTYTVIDVNQAATTFPAPPSDSWTGTVHPVRTWVEGSPSLQQVWRKGRLARLTDPVSKRSINLTYAPSSACGDVAPGFIAPPAGMLCQGSDWAGQLTRISYVQARDGAQIGRITIQAQAGPGAAVTDVAYDQAARPVAIRQPLAAAAVASGAVSGLGDQDARALTQIQYDSRGRVETITPPAGLVPGDEQTDAQSARMAQRLDWRTDTPGQSTLTVRQDGIRAPFVEQSVANVSTMDQTLVVGPDGCRARATFNADDNVTTTRNECDGTQSSVRYDASGHPVESRGPTRRALNAAGVGSMRTRYDTAKRPGSANASGDPIKGLVLMSFDNQQFAGVPATRSVGPVIDGITPARMVLNFASNPSGAGGPWSARISGDYVAPVKGTYRFLTASPGAQMFVNGRDCTARACTVDLRAGAYAHVQASLRATGAAGITLEAARPGRALEPMPTERLRPSLHQVTVQSTDDELSATGAPQRLENVLQYDNESGGQLVKETSAKGTTVRYRWAPDTGANGNFGQRTGWVNPRGKVTKERYFGGTQTATSCDGKAIQGGLLRDTSPPGGPASAQVYDKAGRLAKATGPGTEMCITHGADGQATAGAVTGSLPSYALSSDARTGGNPLLQSGTVTAQGVTSAESRSISITGRTFQQTDALGTVTTLAYDPATGATTSIVERTAKGQQRTRTFEYDDLGRATAMAVDGTELERITYRNDGFPLHVDYHNGTRASLELDQNNNPNAITYSGFAGGASVREDSSFSRGGSVLRRTLTAPDGTSTFTYTYDKDHRLTRSAVTGTMPVRTRESAMAFTGTSGANGNRQSEVTTDSTGAKKTWSFRYDGSDRLISSNKPGINPVGYDAQGRATRVGESELAYDAGGNLISVASGAGSVAFGGGGETTFQPASGAPVTLRPSGDLLLDAQGMIAGQVVGLAQGVRVGIDASGAPVRWTYDDLQGSVAWRTTGGDAPQHTTVYDPWGTQISSADQPTPATELDLAMSMQGWAGTTRLPIGDDVYVMGAREYSPAAGRFVQPDPVVGGSMNPFEFAGGDPLNSRDPSGNFSAGRGWAIGVSIAVAVVAAIATKGASIAVMSVKKGAMIGAATGAVSGAASSATQQLVDNGMDEFDWKALGVQAATGAAVGAVVGAASAKIATAKQSATQAAWQGKADAWQGKADRLLRETGDHRLGGWAEQKLATLGRKIRAGGGSFALVAQQDNSYLALVTVPTVPLSTSIMAAGFAVAGTGAPVFSVFPVLNPFASTTGPAQPDPGPGSPDDGTFDAGSAAGPALRAIVGG